MEEVKNLVYTVLGKLDHMEHNMLITSKNVLTIDEVSKLTGLSKNTIHQYTSEKSMPHYKHGNKLFFKRVEVEDWLLGTKVEMRGNGK